MLGCSAEEQVLEGRDIVFSIAVLRFLLDEVCLGEADGS